MASDESADESAFIDCVASGSEIVVETPAGRRRRVSVTEMVRRAETRSTKRPAPDRGSRSPHDPALPAAKRPLAGPTEPGGVEPSAGAPAAPGGVELSAGALSSIRRLVDDGIASVISAFDARFERLERRLSVLESEAMDRDIQVRSLTEQLARQTQLNADLQAQVESIDLNRRLSSLILTCDDFGRRSANEDMEDAVARLLNERIPGLNLTTADIQAAHRLQRDNKVIARFVKRSVRDRIFDARFSLSSYRVTSGSHTRDDRRRSSLFISESLTVNNQWLYNQLLQARKSSDGTKVAQVFSRRGLVYCRTVKNGPNIRVPDVAALQRIIGGASARRSASALGRDAATAGAGPASAVEDGGVSPRSPAAQPGGGSGAPRAGSPPAASAVAAGSSDALASGGGRPGAAAATVSVKDGRPSGGEGERRAAQLSAGRPAAGGAAPTADGQAPVVVSWVPAAAAGESSGTTSETPPASESGVSAGAAVGTYSAGEVETSAGATAGASSVAAPGPPDGGV